MKIFLFSFCLPAWFNSSPPLLRMLHDTLIIKTSSVGIADLWQNIKQTILPIMKHSKYFLLITIIDKYRNTGLFLMNEKL